MPNVFALTTRGLETVSAAELAALPGVTLHQTAYRRIRANCTDSLDSLLTLRTVDDVYLDLATWVDVHHTRNMLPVLEWYATQLELDTARERIANFRPVPQTPMYSITASFVGKRNYSSDEIKTSMAEGIAAGFDWRYTPDDRTADLNLRIFIEHEVAFVGLRLGKNPLHERSYKTIQHPGSLKPPVAAAMLQLVSLLPEQHLLDPCCGAGTILIEAALSGAIAEGGDIDPVAVEAALTNAVQAGVSIKIQEWDARALPIPDSQTDCIVTNLPWGKQIPVDDALADFYRDVCLEMERGLTKKGHIAILTSAPHLLHFEELQLIQSSEISLYGQKPTICIFRYP